MRGWGRRKGGAEGRGRREGGRRGEGEGEREGGRKGEGEEEREGTGKVSLEPMLFTPSFLSLICNMPSSFGTKPSRKIQI